VTSGTGTPLTTIGYDAFGNVTSDTTPAQADRFGYAGAATDLITGLEMNGNGTREYNPAVGRFDQLDPKGFGAGDVNLYRYVCNNATGKIDPSGLDGIISITPHALPKVDSIKVTCSNAGATISTFYAEFIVTIKGSDLTQCEYTQYITNSTEMWDERGESLSKDAIYAAYKKRKIEYGVGSDPFANNVLDDGWHNGNNWNKFSDDNTKTVTDKHKHIVPKEFSGTPIRYYVYKCKSTMEIKVRISATQEVIATHSWSYVYQNYSDKPVEANIKKVACGIYSYSGIESIPKDVDKTEKKK
jgi:RHS repeat-associated protein